MSRGRSRARHRASPEPRLLGTAAVCALVAGCAVIGSAVAPGPAAVAADEAPDAAVVEVASVRPAGAGSAAGAPATAPSTADPVALSIPAIGVDAPLVRLGTAGDGTLEVPVDAAQAGWFTGGAAPGARGPAVIAGHVDSVDGAGVFIGLERLVVGDEITVARADGTTVAFVVTESLRTPKDEFPTDLVYGPAAGSELRLITCDGRFDRDSGHYEDNLVVFARLVT